jgi:hypothetical protein
MLNKGDIVLVFYNMLVADNKRVADMVKIVDAPGENQPFIVFVTKDGKVIHQNPHSFNLDLIQTYSEKDASRDKKDKEYAELKKVEVEYGKCCGKDCQ